jgi:hypothetical protein
MLTSERWPCAATAPSALTCGGWMRCSILSCDKKKQADQVVVIDHGQIVEQGTHQSLLDRRGFYHHLYVSQFKGQAI